MTITSHESLSTAGVIGQAGSGRNHQPDRFQPLNVIRATAYLRSGEKIVNPEDALLQPVEANFERLSALIAFIAVADTSSASKVCVGDVVQFVHRDAEIGLEVNTQSLQLCLSWSDLDRDHCGRGHLDLIVMSHCVTRRDSPVIALHYSNQTQNI